MSCTSDNSSRSNNGFYKNDTFASPSCALEVRGNKFVNKRRNRVGNVCLYVCQYARRKPLFIGILCVFMKSHIYSNDVFLWKVTPFPKGVYSMKSHTFSLCVLYEESLLFLNRFLWVDMYFQFTWNKTTFYFE